MKGRPLIEVLFESDGNMPKKAPGTTPTQMRLDATTKAEIEALRLHFGLSSLAETVRYATHKLYQEITKGKGKP